jgi:hypothetical protein
MTSKVRKITTKFAKSLDKPVKYGINTWATVNVAKIIPFSNHGRHRIFPQTNESTISCAWQSNLCLQSLRILLSWRFPGFMSTHLAEILSLVEICSVTMTQDGLRDCHLLRESLGQNLQMLSQKNRLGSWVSRRQDLFRRLNVFLVLRPVIGTLEISWQIDLSKPIS